MQAGYRTRIKTKKIEPLANWKKGGSDSPHEVSHIQGWSEGDWPFRKWLRSPRSPIRLGYHKRSGYEGNTVFVQFYKETGRLWFQL